jgi:hypothetical protein
MLDKLSIIKMLGNVYREPLLFFRLDVKILLLP